MAPMGIKQRLKRRLRTASVGAYQRMLGREVAYLDFDRLIELGAIETGRHFIGRPFVHYYRDAGVKAKVIIGNFSGCANDSEFMPGSEHRSDWIAHLPLRIIYDRGPRGIDGPFSKGDIVLGSDVWVGFAAKILSGVTIGDGAVIGAGAIIAKDVRPYAVMVGNPAREIKRRFTDEQVDALLRIRWWDWPDKKIADNSDLLMSERIDEFIAQYDIAE